MSVRTLEGDCRAILPTLPAASVQCVVTSPPYWGLRDYGTAAWEGGDAACDHLGPPVRTQAGFNARYFGKEFASDKQGDEREPMGQTCRKCGARRIDAQLGLEPTPEAYVAAMVGAFREVRRVLRDDGTCWLNMGDSYAGGDGIGRNDADRNFTGGGDNHLGSGNPGKQGIHLKRTSLKPKDLVGMPWRLAFALQADGWYLRADIIWAKPNPMPESVTDRPTKAHEYVFLLTKAARYFYDADAVREPHARLWDESNGGSLTGGNRRLTMAGRNDGGRTALPLPNPAGRNLRSVWTINPEPFPDAHFATFPTALAARCIQAGSSEKGCCAACGAPWARVVELGDLRPVRGTYLGPIEDGAKLDGRAGFHGAQKTMVRTSEGWSFLKRDRMVRGWQPSCACAAPVVPCTVLDPFGGSGTVGAVAEELGRDSILIELSRPYVAMARQRTAQLGLFSSRPGAAARL